MIGVIFAGVGAVRLFGYLKLRRMRMLTCPCCQRPFAVASLASVRRWMDLDIERGSTKASGFYLHCTHCAVDYRFTDGFQGLGVVEQTTTSA
jgi:uncharacterized protein YbaR (Trm112 family)